MSTNFVNVKRAKISLLRAGDLLELAALEAEKGVAVAVFGNDVQLSEIENGLSNLRYIHLLERSDYRIGDRVSVERADGTVYGTIFQISVNAENIAWIRYDSGDRVPLAFFRLLPVFDPVTSV